MRPVSILCLVLAMAVAPPWVQAQTLDPDLDVAIQDLLQQREFDGEVGDRVRQALEDAASEDPSVRDGLLFFHQSAALITSDTSEPIVALMARGDVQAWGRVRALGRLYQGDGVLSSVDYEGMTRSGDRGWLIRNLDAYTEAVAEENEVVGLLKRYNLARVSGLTPGEAWERVGDLTEDSSWAGEAYGALVEQMANLGDFALRGQDRDDVERDVAGFLEARYVLMLHHAGRGDLAPKGVAPAGSPAEYISHRVIAALRRDQARMLMPVQRIIDRAVYVQRGDDIVETTPAADCSRPSTDDDQTCWVKLRFTYARKLPSAASHYWDLQQEQVEAYQWIKGWRTVWEVVSEKWNANPEGFTGGSDFCEREPRTGPEDDHEGSPVKLEVVSASVRSPADPAERIVVQRWTTMKTCYH